MPNLGHRDGLPSPAADVLMESMPKLSGQGCLVSLGFSVAEMR
jgi:hypothetical protein